MKTLITAILALFLVACAGKEVQMENMPDGSSKPVLVDTETGETSDPVAATETVGNAIGSLFGVPFLGIGVAAVLASVLASRATGSKA